MFKNTLFLAFGTILHQYSVLWNQWIEHKDYGENIERIFRQNVDPSDKFGVFEPNVLTESGKVYKNVAINDNPNHEIIKVTDQPTCTAPGPIDCSYVEKHFANILYC